MSLLRICWSAGVTTQCRMSDNASVRHCQNPLFNTLKTNFFPPIHPKLTLQQRSRIWQLRSLGGLNMPQTICTCAVLTSRQLINIRWSDVGHCADPAEALFDRTPTIIWVWNVCCTDNFWRWWLLSFTPMNTGCILYYCVTEKTYPCDAVTCISFKHTSSSGVSHIFLWISVAAFITIEDMSGSHCNVTVTNAKKKLM